MSTEGSDGDQYESYTRRRLQHATPEHLHITSRRCFIGPIPANWLKSHQSWTKRQLHLTNYSSKVATFSAAPNTSHARRLTALPGSPVSAKLTPSFPQPRDVAEETGEDESTEEEEDQDESPAHSSRKDNSQSAVVADDANEGQITVTGPAETDSSPGSRNPETTTSDVNPDNQVRRDGRRSSPSASFVTAQEQMSKTHLENGKGSAQGRNKLKSSTLSTTEEETGPIVNVTSMKSTESMRRSTSSAPSPTPGQQSREGEETASTSPLITRNKNTPLGEPLTQDTQRKAMRSSSTLQHAAPEEYQGPHQEDVSKKRVSRVPSPGLLRFNLPNRAAKYEKQARTKFAQVRGSKHFRKDVLKPGEIVKAEKMLVRVDFTIHDLPKDYDENESMKIESTAVDKWKELMVVCRKNTKLDECEFVIQLCKSRVIAGVENDQKLKQSAHLIQMNRKSTKVNMYSTLDKTIVIWAPWKKGTRIYILKPQSSASSVEWYTFLQSSLGWKRTKGLQISVPDLDICLDIEDPFKELEQIQRSETLSGENGAAVVQKTFQAEHAAASNIVQQSMKMLTENPEWEHVISAWLKHERMGLAWKKYDRLEWVHGANEQKMYGTMAMQETHDLELRPKRHYPTHVSPSQGSVEEPAAVEGFLIRLTTQKGRHSRLGKKYFNRMYFYTHNQFLCFCKPGKADPPTPPQKSSLQQPGEVPLIYAVDPFPIRGKDIRWRGGGNLAEQQRHDKAAYSEAERKINTMLVAEGYVNLCHVVEFRNVLETAQDNPQTAETQAQDQDREQISNTSANPEPKGNKAHDNDFELVFRNSLVLRLQSFNPVTKKEWITRLGEIAEYWKLRVAADMNAYKLARQSNFERLKLDEDMESYISQAAKKWEVSRSTASPELFNMCGISSCRAITVGNHLLHLPRACLRFSLTCASTIDPICEPHLYESSHRSHICIHVY